MHSLQIKVDDRIHQRVETTLLPKLSATAVDVRACVVVVCQSGNRQHFNRERVSFRLSFRILNPITATTNICIHTNKQTCLIPSTILSRKH